MSTEASGRKEALGGAGHHGAMREPEGDDAGHRAQPRGVMGLDSDHMGGDRMEPCDVEASAGT